MNKLQQELGKRYPLINSGKLQPSTRVDQKLVDARGNIQDAQEKAEREGKKLSPNSNLFRNYKSMLPLVLPIYIFAVLLGNMLGDCSVRYNPKTNEACLQFEWGNKAYAYFIYNVLFDYVLSPPREQVRINAFGNSVTTYCFQTITHSSFAVFFHLFIDHKVKTVPTGLIVNLVSALTLAVWYMDDGGLTDYRGGLGQGIQLHTQGFTLRRVEEMSTELNDKFGFGCWVRLVKKGQPIICLPSRAYPQFYDLVKDYIHPSMRHKLPLPLK